MSTPFAVRRHDEDGFVRLAVSGELAEEASEALVEIVVNVVCTQVRELVIDVDGVSFLGARGIRGLLLGREAALRQRCVYRVVNAHGIVHTVLEISGLTDLLKVTTMAEPIPDSVNQSASRDM